MPYSKEHANAYGYEGIVTDDFLRDRLRSYSFKPLERLTEPGPEDALLITELESLPLSRPPDSIRQAYAMDGSAASADELFPFEVTAVKLGCVRQDLAGLQALNSTPGPLDPTAFKTVYERAERLTLLPGEGVFGDKPGEDMWQDKFREELYQAFRHFSLPFSPERATALDLLKSLVPASVKTRCLACHETGRLTPEENVIQLSTPAPYCGGCLREAYFTDFLFTESWLREGKASALPLAIMLILERVLMQGLVEKAVREGTSESTAFFIDGPLAFYSTHSLNKYFLKALQAQPNVVMVGLEKTGTYARFSRRDEVQALLKPGSVGMVTSAVSTLLQGSEEESSGRVYSYGKRFLYRTRDGLRTYVLMVPPMRGGPKPTGPQDESETWANYPHLRLICELIELQTTEAFGTREAAIDIIAEANHAASLPSRLSLHFLTELLRDEGAPEKELNFDV